MGPLIRVHAKPIQQKPTPDPAVKIQQEVDIPLIPEISMTRYAITRPKTHLPVAPLRLTVIWQAKADLSADYKISARLLDETGQIGAVVDKVPVHFAYPTSAWRSSEFISDVYDLSLTANFIPGSYTPLFILYNPANESAELGRITLPPTYIQ